MHKSAQISRIPMQSNRIMQKSAQISTTPNAIQQIEKHSLTVDRSHILSISGNEVNLRPSVCFEGTITLSACTRAIIGAPTGSLQRRGSLSCTNMARVKVSPMLPVLAFLSFSFEITALSFKTRARSLSLCARLCAAMMASVWSSVSFSPQTPVSRRIHSSKDTAMDRKFSSSSPSSASKDSLPTSLSPALLTRFDSPATGSTTQGASSSAISAWIVRPSRARASIFAIAMGARSSRPMYNSLFASPCR